MQEPIRAFKVSFSESDKEKGLAVLQELAKAVPVGAALLAKPLRVQEPEEWGEELWRITTVGETAPGREWLIENFFVNAIKEVDSLVRSKADRVFVYEPLARYADPVADKKFKRAVRASRDEHDKI